MSCRCSIGILDEIRPTKYLLDYNEKKYSISELELIRKSWNRTSDISSAVKDVEFTIMQQIGEGKLGPVEDNNFKKEYYPIIAYLLSKGWLEDCKVKD